MSIVNTKSYFQSWQKKSKKVIRQKISSHIIKFYAIKVWPCEPLTCHSRHYRGSEREPWRQPRSGWGCSWLPPYDEPPSGWCSMQWAVEWRLGFHYWHNNTFYWEERSKLVDLQLVISIIAIVTNLLRIC